MSHYIDKYTMLSINSSHTTVK